MQQLTDDQRAYQVLVNRFHGVRPAKELAGSDRPAYVLWWTKTLDARAALLKAQARERQARQDAALLPKATGHEPRKRSASVARVNDSDAYAATILLDRRVGVMVNPRSRHSVRGGKTAYECVVTRPNGAHLEGKPLCKGQVIRATLGMLESAQEVAKATPTGTRAKRNAAKQKAVKAAVKPVVKTVPPKVEKAIREFAPTREVAERLIVAAIQGHNNVASK